MERQDSTNDSIVNRIFTKIKEHLDTNPGLMGASKVLYTLSKAACYLGRDNTEEAKLFQLKWEGIKDRLANMADRSEFLSSGKLIDESIDQVINPIKHKYATNRDHSTLKENEVDLVEELTV